MRPSLRTFAITIIGFGSVALLRTALELNSGNEALTLAISDYGEAGILVLLAVCALACAVRMPRTVPSQKGPWVLVALGILSFAVGDVIWAHQEVLLGLDPYPGISDVFYLSQYALLGGALAVAGMRAGSRPDRSAALGFSACFGAFALVLLWVLLLQPYVLRAGASSGLELALGVFYPAADVALLFTPALFVTLLMTRVGNGKWAVPWMVVAGGAMLLAASDAGFTWLDASGEYAAGGLVDYGWTLAHVLMTIGVSIARDLADPVPSMVRLVREGEEVLPDQAGNGGEARGA